MDDVIEELAKTWDTLGTVEQNEIGKAMAGTRQRDQFLILMNNYNNVAEDRVSVEKLLETQLDATGLANDRYAIYLENVEAAQNKSTAAWEALWQATIQSDALVWFYNMSAATMDLATKAGGLIPVVGALLAAFLVFKSTAILGFITSGLASFTTTLGGAFLQALLTNTITVQGFSMALAGLKTAALGLLNPVTLVIAAIGLLIYSYNKYKDIQNSIAEGEANIASKVDAKITRLKEEKASVDDITSAYQQTMQATRQGGENTPMLSGALKDVRTDIMQKYSGLIFDTAKNYEEYAEAMKKVVKESGGMVDEQGRIYTAMQTAHGEVRTYIDGVTVLTKEMYEGGKGAQEYRAYLALVASEEEKMGQAPEALEVTWLGLANTIRGVTDEFSKLDGLIQKSLEGNLSFEDVATLPAEYIDALEVENGLIKLNVDMLKEEELQIMRNAVSKTEAAYNNKLASEAELSVMRMKLEAMEADAAKTHSVFQLTAWDYENLMWQMANQASAAGEKVFFDMQGNALNSAKAIFDFMSSSDANFMNLVSQYAKAVGITVAQAMQQVGAYVNATYNDGVAKMNSLLNYAGYGGGLSYATGDLKYQQGGGGGNKPSTPFSSTPLPSLGGGGGGGGGGSTKADKKADRERQAEERQREIEKLIEKERKKAIDGLKTQLDLYKDIIDARKSILDTMADERKYQDDVKEKQADILRIQNELAALQFENTPEAKARRLELEAELKDTQKALEDIQYDQSVEQQKAALDASYQQFADKMNNAIKLIENIEATSVGDFTSQLAVILSQLSAQKTPTDRPLQKAGTAPPPMFHDGAERGIVGTGSKTGELFAKLMSGELVSNDSQMKNFMTRTLPSLIGSPAQSYSGGSGMSFDKLFDLVVQGNLDSSVLPDIERISNKIVDRINASLLNRGIIRNTNLTKI